MDVLDTLLVFDLQAFVSIVFIDLVLSGDNALIIGLAVSGLPPLLRRRAIVFGIAAATILRILFSALTYQLLSIIGLTLAGGILLLWVAYKMWRELRPAASTGEEKKEGGTSPQKTFRGAMVSIIIADVSMSLDNVLAVAGAAHGYPGMLIFGLVLSIILMAFAANFIAVLLEKYKWIAYIGIAIVAYVAVDMIWRGSSEVLAFAGGG